MQQKLLKLAQLFTELYQKQNGDNMFPGDTARNDNNSILHTTYMYRKRSTSGTNKGDDSHTMTHLTHPQALSVHSAPQLVLVSGYC